MVFQRGQATDVKDIFHQVKENYRPARVTRNLIFNFIIDDELWTVSLSPQSCTIVEGANAEVADCTLEMPKEIFLGSFNGSYRPSITDLFTGKIKVDRPEMLYAFKELFGSF
jgi:putative sterol carrier protein